MPVAKLIITFFSPSNCLTFNKSEKDDSLSLSVDDCTFAFIVVLVSSRGVQSIFGAIFISLTVLFLIGHSSWTSLSRLKRKESDLTKKKM